MTLSATGREAERTFTYSGWTKKKTTFSANVSNRQEE